MRAISLHAYLREILPMLTEPKEFIWRLREYDAERAQLTFFVFFIILLINSATTVSVSHIFIY